MTRYAKTMSDALREVREAIDETVLDTVLSISKGGSRYKDQEKDKDGKFIVKDRLGKVITSLSPAGAKKFLDSLKDPISGKGSVDALKKDRERRASGDSGGMGVRTRGTPEKNIVNLLRKFKEEVDLDEKFTKKDFAKNEDDNLHTENGIELVKMFGTPEENIKMGGIAARHNMKGSISRKDQQERDALVKKYYPKLKEGVELDEALKHTHMVLGPDGRVIGMSSNERGANDIAKNNLLKVKGRVVKLRKPMSSTRGDRLIGMLPADNLGEETLNEQPEHEIQVGGYTTKHFHMCGSAQKVMKKHADKDGAEELTKLQDKFYEIEMMAMNAGKPTDEQISQTKTLYNQIMSKAKEMGIDDEVGGYMKMHMDSMEKGDPKLGFGRTDKDDGKEPIDEKYDLYHSTFSGAMQHAYDYAKKKLGITVDPKEIDSKVATGPRKPSEGKTNKYRLKGKGGNLQIQVYNKGGSKPFELNMYKEETELDEMIPKSTMYALVKDGKVVAKGSKSDMMSKMKKEGGKVFNAPSKKVGDTIKEENEMNEKKKLKSGVKFDFRLFDPEDSPGSDKANDDMNKEIQKAVRMKDKETARQHMMKVQKKHSKHGATDTEPREVINQILDAIYEARERVNEGYESEVKKVLDKEGIDGYFKNGKLYVSKRDAKDAKKALEDSDEITKLPPMVKEEKDMTKNLKDTIMDMWKEAVSPAQQAAIAISKKEKEKEEGNAFTGALKAAKEKGEKTFTVAGKEYDVKTEKLVGGQKKLDKDKDGDIDGKDFAMLRKQKKNEELEKERYRYLETKRGSVRESILKIWGEISEKVEYVEYKFKNKNDAMAAKKMLDGMQMMSFDINDDNISNGELMVDAGSKDMTKVHKDIMKKYRPKVMTQEKKDLTKNEKHDSVKKTDTGKEMTPVDMSPKMPKVKESKNKV